jgi:mRNA-degrading endonuclease RelE of RelBE toxin-antitoxin system
MREIRTSHFKRSYKKLPKEIRLAFAKQMRFLVTDIRHPSLRAKKYDETSGIWQARITNNVRLYFKIEGDICYLIEIEKHSD